MSDKQLDAIAKVFAMYREKYEDDIEINEVLNDVFLEIGINESLTPKEVEIYIEESIKKKMIKDTIDKHRFVYDIPDVAI
jgi:hypothetical protein